MLGLAEGLITESIAFEMVGLMWLQTFFLVLIYLQLTFGDEN